MPFMEVRLYQKLIVWQEAHRLCLQIYKVTKSFPADEKFGLVNQMRRAAYSVPTNLAEGNSRRSKKDKSYFVDIAIGSLEELHYQCTLSRDLGYMNSEQFASLNSHIGSVGYLLYKLRSSLQ
jgi:four helix bundle protein